MHTWAHTRPHTHARAPGRTRALRALLHTWSGSEWGHGHHGGSSVREGAEALRAETQTLAGRTAAASRPAPPRRPAAPRQDAPGALPDLAPSKVAFPQPDWCGWVHCHLTDGSGPPEVCGGVAAPHCFLGGVPLDARTAGGGPRSSAQPGLHTAARPLRGPSEATSCSIDYDASLFTPISHFSGDSAGYSPNQEQTQYLFLQRARKRTISIRIIFPSSVLRAPKIVLRLPGLVAG